MAAVVMESAMARVLQVALHGLPRRREPDRTEPPGAGFRLLAPKARRTGGEAVRLSVTDGLPPVRKQRGMGPIRSGQKRLPLAVVHSHGQIRSCPSTLPGGAGGKT